MSDEYLPQETEKTLNKKAGISVLTIKNSENVSTITENYLPDTETTTLEFSSASIVLHIILYRLRHIKLGQA